MNEQEKQKYMEEYNQAKESGVPFYPDILFKDSIIALIVFLILLALAFFVGAPLETQADPADTTYTPKPEWYFLFLFQLLKYFPGQLEFVGVVLIPTIVIVILFALPFLDTSAKRHFTSRPLVTIITVGIVMIVVALTVQSVREAPPPSEASIGDPTAALYTDNCAGCHGEAIDVNPGTNLHDIISRGSHADMPAWSADLTTDEIDALAGFILSPAGNELFLNHCEECHSVQELVAGDPLDLKNALELGPGFPSHKGLDLTDWSEVFLPEEKTALVNFLIAPDGRRLFVTNCSSCHGAAVGFSGEREELIDIVNEGGLHLEMPPWQEKLTENEIDRLALYVVKPSESGQDLFNQYCERCHGERIPSADDFGKAKDIIATGGTHQTMPVWGDVLTNEQLEALVDYTMDSTSGAPLAIGQQLYIDNCATCHGDFGEGGENPARPDDVIAPISTSEYLKTRDDFTLTAIIAQGQPNFGMSPFGSAFGGPLDDDQIDSLVTFIRSWESNPPVELPPEVSVATVDLSGYEIFTEICAQCHGLNGAGDTGPSLLDADFRQSSTRQDIFDTISQGHDATDMIAWGAILSSDQIEQLVNYIEQLPIEESEPEQDEEPQDTEPTPEPDGDTTTDDEVETEEEREVSFSTDIAPLFDNRCVDCHGSDGGWDASTYDLVINSGDHSPVIIPGDPENSLLAQKLIGTHEEGDLMPPPPLRALQEELIQIVIDWIAAGAPDN